MTTSPDTSRPRLARRRFLVGAAALGAGLGVRGLGAEPAGALVAGVATPGPLSVPEAPAATLRAITFPVSGASGYVDDFGVNRAGGRLHQGIDVFGVKLQHLLAAVDGEVIWILEQGGLAGNGLAIRDAAGWEYRYLHVNNDSPGTDDNANPPEWRFAPGIAVGARVRAGQHVGYLGDSGNAERTPPHLHFEIRRPDGRPVNPYPSLVLAQGRAVGNHCRADDGASRGSTAPGYWIATSDGGVYSFGDAVYRGSLGGRGLADVMVGIAATPTGRGYWLAGRDGGVFAFGDAPYRGTTGRLPATNAITGIVATRTGRGYWLVARDGGVYSFGDARFRGSMGGRRLGGRVVGMAVTPSNRGYWLVGDDGGVFAFGDATFHGRLNRRPRDEAVVGIAGTPSGRGYWLATADGRIAPFGDARDLGSPHGVGCGLPRVTAITATRSLPGYWIVTADGRLFGFGAAARHGGLLDAGQVGPAPTVGLAPLQGGRWRAAAALLP